MRLRKFIAPHHHPVVFISAMLVLGLMVACAPQGGPVPAPDIPSGTAPTPSPVPLEAPVVGAPALVMVRMFDERQGWGVSDGAVLRTIDGGNTWHNVSPANTTFGYAATTEFLDVLQGWVLLSDPADPLSGILYRTNDGGAHWNEAAVPFGGGTLRFLDSRQGWMLASLGAGAGSMAVAVFQTKDAGANWTQMYVNDPTQAGAGDSLPLGGLKDGLTPASMQTAWIGGVIYQPGRVYLYKTSDGGRTWIPVVLPTPQGYSEAELETVGPILTTTERAYLPVHISSQNGVLLAVYVSKDGGSSWTLSPTFVPQGGSVDFVAEDVGLAWNGTSFYVTSDGAQSWAAITPDVDFTDSFAGMDFVSPEVGFVLSDQGERGKFLYVTHDSGATWNIVGR